MNTTETWLKTVQTILSAGKDVSPRGQGTREILGNQTIIPMSLPYIFVPERKISIPFLFGEAYWVLSGSNRVADIAKYLKNIRQYSDNGITFRGAYGPQVVSQLDYAVSSIIADSTSRQSVINIWNKNPAPSKDIPCTIALQFLVRDNALHCVATMRSSDIWVGWVYDVFNFSMISAWVAIAVRKHFKEHFPNSPLAKLTLGGLILTAGSQHLYDVSFPAAKEILTKYGEDLCPVPRDMLPLNLDNYSHPDDLLLDLKAAADGNTLGTSPFMSQMFGW